eukprot:scaffold1203_cov117-Cylindrotheca_fusiformis.AAC.19
MVVVTRKQRKEKLAHKESETWQTSQATMPMVLDCEPTRILANSPPVAVLLPSPPKLGGEKRDLGHEEFPADRTLVKKPRPAWVLAEGPKLPRMANMVPACVVRAYSGYQFGKFKCSQEGCTVPNPTAKFVLRIGDTIKRRMDLTPGSKVLVEKRIVDVDRSRIHVGIDKTTALELDEKMFKFFSVVQNGVEIKFPKKRKHIWVERNPDKSRVLLRESLAQPYGDLVIGGARKEYQVPGTGGNCGTIIRLDALPIPRLKEDSCDPAVMAFSQAEYPEIKMKMRKDGIVPVSAQCPICKNDIDLREEGITKLKWNSLDFLTRCEPPPHQYTSGMRAGFSSHWTKLSNLLFDHCKAHCHAPFHCLIEWKAIRFSPPEKGSLGAWTLSMQVQSQLSSAFARAGGIDIRSVDCITAKRTDQSALKMRLTKILGIAIGLGPSEVLLLKDRKFVSSCKEVSPKEKSRAVARFVNDSTEMLERILQKFLDFDFHLYIVHEMDNETFSVWNSLCCFFQRGMYFEDNFPPLHEINWSPLQPANCLLKHYISRGTGCHNLSSLES